MSESTPAGTERSGRLAGVRDLASRLYRGEAGLDVVGLRRYSYLVVAAILVIALLSFMFRGFTLGIEFQGGRSFTVPASVGTLEQARAGQLPAGKLSARDRGTERRRSLKVAR